MADTSFLLFLISVLLFVSVSFAYRPLVVEKYEAAAPSSPTIKEDNNDVIDDVDIVNPNIEVIGVTYPNKVHDSGFQFQLGPIGFGASWNLGFPFPIFGPPVVMPQYTLPYYQQGSYLNPYEVSDQSLSGQGSSLNLPIGYAPLASSKGVNSQSTHN